MLQLVGDETVDLVYLDPPFNSQQNYNMLFGSETGEDTAQIRAFDDTWYWRDTDHGEILHHLLMRGGAIGNMAEAMHLILGRCGMLAYLLYMTERLIALHRVMKPTASLYPHCDPTASHYLKIALDAVFGASMFRNEIVWKRSTSHNDAKRYGRITDRILFFSKSNEWTWNGDSVRAALNETELRDKYKKTDSRGHYTLENLTGPAHGQKRGESIKPWKNYNVISRGRVWSAPLTGKYASYIDEVIIRGYKQISSIHDRLDALDRHGLIHHPKNGSWPSLKKYAGSDTGKPAQELILKPTGFTNYSSKGREYLGYPTQKPVALLKRIIQASCPEGGLVLDPFCGCGTAIDAAQALGRRWIGMDISCLAVNVMQERMMNIHGPAALADVNITGIPT